MQRVAKYAARTRLAGAHVLRGATPAIRGVGVHVTGNDKARSQKIGLEEAFTLSGSSLESS